MKLTCPLIFTVLLGLTLGTWHCAAHKSHHSGTRGSKATKSSKATKGSKGPKASKGDERDHYDDLEDFLRDNSNVYRLALYRSYLPMTGRREVPLPTIQRVESTGKEDPLPACPLTRKIDEDEVDFSPVLKLLKSGDGDEIDFIVALARVMEVPVTGHPENDFPFCAWWGYVDERFFNWIFPDATATYWFQPLVAPAESEEYPEWFLKGKFVEERYKSVALYDTSFNPFEWEVFNDDHEPFYYSSTLTDYQMKPSNGHNPFQTPDLPLHDYGEFQVLMKNKPTFDDASIPEVNVIPMQSTPSGGGSSGEVEGISGGIPLPVPCGREGAFPCPLEGIFQIPSQKLEQGVVSNLNNAYIVTITNQLTPRETEPLQVTPTALVIRGRIPVTSGNKMPPLDVECSRGPRESADICYCERNPDSCKPIAWTGKENPAPQNTSDIYSGPLDPTEAELRYWSVCTAVYERPYPTIGNILPENRFRENTGCVPDSDIIQTDEHGYPDPHGGWFTIVITTGENKPKIFKDKNGGIRNTHVGANWVEGVEGLKMLVNLRNMFANSNFEFAGTRAGANSAWQDTYDTMQEYYPVISATCTVELINTLGWAACVAPELSANTTCGGLESCM